MRGEGVEAMDLARAVRSIISILNSPWIYRQPGWIIHSLAFSASMITILYSLEGSQGLLNNIIGITVASMFAIGVNGIGQSVSFDKMHKIRSIHIITDINEEIPPRDLPGRALRIAASHSTSCNYIDSRRPDVCARNEHPAIHSTHDVRCIHRLAIGFGFRGSYSISAITTPRIRIIILATSILSSGHPTSNS
jgi:hypothetical protein